MRRGLPLVLVFCIALASCFFFPDTARAFGPEWKQDDWSGGPGRRSGRTRPDTNHLPGSIPPGSVRLSFVSSGYDKDPDNPVIPQGGDGSSDETRLFSFPEKRTAAGYEDLYDATDAAGVSAIGSTTRISPGRGFPDRDRFPLPRPRRP